MKTIKFLTASLLLLSCTCLQAQSKWFAYPLVGVATMNENWGYTANLTFGRQLTDFGVSGRLRTDVTAGYFGFSENKIYSAAAILTACDDGTSKWHTSWSLGLGIQKSENRDKYDFIVPLKMTLPFTAYRFNDKMCLGLDWGGNLNFSDFLSGTIVYLGVFFAFGGL